MTTLVTARCRKHDVTISVDLRDNRLHIQVSSEKAHYLGNFGNYMNADFEEISTTVMYEDIKYYLTNQSKSKNKAHVQLFSAKCNEQQCKLLFIQRYKGTGFDLIVPIETSS